MTNVRGEKMGMDTKTEGSNKIGIYLKVLLEISILFSNPFISKEFFKFFSGQQRY